MSYGYNVFQLVCSKQGRIYKKGIEMTLSLSTKAMEKGEGKTAMMRKYN